MIRSRTTALLIGLLTAATLVVVGVQWCDDPAAWFGILTQSTFRPTLTRLGHDDFVTASRYLQQVRDSEKYFDTSSPEHFAGWKAVDSNSRSWAEGVLAPSANPYLVSPPPIRSWSQGNGLPDLLSHQYTVENIEVSTVEGISFLLIRIPRPSGWLARQSQREIRRWLEHLTRVLFNLDQDVLSLSGTRKIDLHFEYHPPLHAGSQFSTNVRFPLDLEEPPLRSALWIDRVDGGVEDNGVFFLVYKMREKEHMKGYVNGSQWFEGTPYCPLNRVPPDRLARECQ